MRDQSSRPTPTSRIDLPGAAAARFVRAFIVRDTRGCNLLGDSQLNRFPASSHCQITWFLEGGIDMLSSGGQEQNIGLGRCVVGGCQTHPVTSRNRGDVHALMAVFYPDAFHALFGIDLALLQNRSVDAHEILPPHGLELVETVFAARSDSERRQLIERYIVARAPSAALPAWTHIRRLGNGITLKMASAALGTGPRQLQRLALREAGVNLQTMARLLRGERSFFSAQRQQLAGKQVVFAGHAIASEYADQSHMARECKALSGRTPAQLMRDVQTQEADWIYRLEFPDEDSSTTWSA